MFGYRGFAKGRFALGAGGWTGVNFEPGSAQITFTGYAPSLSYSFPPVRLTQNVAEIWLSRADVRVTQIAAEVYRAIGLAEARVTMICAEVFFPIPPTGQGEMPICALW